MQTVNIPLDVLNGYFIYANFFDKGVRKRFFITDIKITFAKIPDKKKSSSKKLIYTDDKKKTVPLSMDYTADVMHALIVPSKKEVELYMDAIGNMNTVLSIKKGDVYKWEYCKVGDMLNHLRKGNK